MTRRYVSSVGWNNVTAWVGGTTQVVGDIVRQSITPTVGLERVFRCTTAGTTNATEPNWGTVSVTQGGTKTDNTVVWTEITGNETYNQGAFNAPFARLATAHSWASAGDTIFVANNHAETQAATIIWSIVGTPTTPVNVLCIATTFTAGGPVAAELSTGATVTTTGASSILLTGIATGSMYGYGIRFNTGSGNNSCSFIFNSTAIGIFDHCAFTLVSTHTGSSIALGATGSWSTNGCWLDWRNCDVAFGNVSQGIVARGLPFKWRGGSVLSTGAAVAPTQLFGPSGFTQNTFIGEVSDVDLSFITSAKFLVNVGNLSPGWYMKFNNCKVATNLGGVITGTVPVTAFGSFAVDFVNSDSTNNVIVREEHYQSAGSILHDTARYRTGGASDGVTPKSWAIASLAGCNFVQRLIGPDIYQRVESTGSKTITMYVASGGTLYDKDIGFDVEYLGDSATPLGTLDTSAPNILEAGNTNNNVVADGTSQWNGTGVGTVQKVQKVVNINRAGLLRVRPFVTKPSQTVYVDPLLNVA